MKRFNFKNKLFSALAFVFVSVAVLASVFFVPQNKNSIESQAATYEVPAISTTVVEELEGESLDSYFSLRTNNPILTENQTYSNFCWSYAGLKALETAFMVQHNEYHNFSDVGMAYAYFVDQMLIYEGDEAGQASVLFNSSGNFDKLNETITDYGLIYEADFSNSKFEDINNNDYENYKYLLELADSEIAKRLNPVSLNGVSTSVLKAFIKKYGGVFAGIEGGIVFTDGKLYQPGTHDTEGTDMDIAGNHAVCLIGWDDSTNTFRALNSWGVASTDVNGRKQYEEFNIPYTYAFLSLGGYILEGESNVQMTASNASDFASSVRERITPIKNLFTCTETVDVSYQLSSKHNFENVYAKVFKGTEDVTHCFSITYDDANSLVRIKEKNFTNVFEGGTYLIKFYEDVKVVGIKELVVYSGTELSYVELYKYTKQADGQTEKANDDIFNFMNTLASSDDTATYYVSGSDTYYLKFYLTDICKVGTGFSFSDIVSDKITTARAYSYDGTSVTETAISTFTVTEKKQYERMFEITISGLSAYVGQMIEFELYLNSTMYSEVTKTLHFQIFLSGDAQIESSDAHKIEYVLNGGVNSSADPATLLDVRNIDRYPDYQREENSSVQMTPFLLVAPTKTNNEFLGWFTDPEFAPESRIYVIDASLASDLVLYAKWLPNENQLFDVSLEMTKATPYGSNENKLLDDNPIFVYGNKLDFESVFTVDPSVEGLFTSKFYFIVNGEEFSVLDLTEAQTLTFSIEHQKLFAGDYNVQVVVAMVISHMEKGSAEANLEFKVNKKELVVDYNNIQSTLVYDGNYHEPIVSLYGKYDFDEALEFEWDRAPQKDVSQNPNGAYEFYITNLSNKNYSLDYSQKYSLVIIPKEVGITWSNLVVTYNGTIQKPTCEINESDLLEGDSAVVELSLNELKDASKYTISVSSLLNKNYKAKASDKTRVFEIKPAELTLTFKPITERIQTLPQNRKQIDDSSYEITGKLYAGDDLHITTYSEGLTATKSGTYKVTASYHNDNYVVNVVNGKYVLTGYYFVDYILPNGEVYREEVEDGKDPKGITREIYDIPGLSGYTYSQPLKNVGEDLTIQVSVTDYSWILYVSLAVVGLGGVYWFITRKARMNKVS